MQTKGWDKFSARYSIKFLSTSLQRKKPEGAKSGESGCLSEN
jgi:hypothetical protein